ncbi:MAG: hypothetical protein N3H31_03970 [Candidatus Nezhaarchaeota archaeon]|nr:hypothetical protein [Candidatus Nezhaarchaeota archaeon]
MSYSVGGEEERCRLRPARDEELRSKGWAFMFIGSGARLWQAVRDYEDAGFEVHLEPIEPEGLEEACRLCVEAEPHVVYAVYTRPKGRSRLDELYG